MGLEYNDKPFDANTFKHDLMREAHEAVAKKIERCLGSITCPKCGKLNRAQVRPGEHGDFDISLLPCCCPEVKEIFDAKVKKELKQ